MQGRKQEFLRWLNTGDSRNNSATFVLRNLIEVSSYALSKGISKESIFDITNLREFNRICLELLGNKLFRCTQKSIYSSFEKTNRLYAEFLRSYQKEENQNKQQANGSIKNQEDNKLSTFIKSIDSLKEVHEEEYINLLAETPNLLSDLKQKLRMKNRYRETIRLNKEDKAEPLYTKKKEMGKTDKDRLFETIIDWNENIDFSRSRPCKIKYRGVEIHPKAWHYLVIDICNMLMQQFPHVDIRNFKFGETSKVIFQEKWNRKYWHKPLKKGLWVDTDFSVNCLVKLIKQLFIYYKIDINELEVTVLCSKHTVSNKKKKVGEDASCKTHYVKNKINKPITVIDNEFEEFFESSKLFFADASCRTFIASVCNDINPIEKEKILKIILTHFENGFRESSNIDFEKFKSYYASKYGEKFTYTIEQLNLFLISEAWVFDDRIYVYDKEVIKAVRKYLHQADSACIYIGMLYDRFASQLYELGIFSADMLKAFIAKSYPDISIKWDYLLMKKDVTPQDVVKEVFFEREVWSYDELQKRLPFIKMDTIRQTMSRPEYFRVGKGQYTHIDNMDLPEKEGRELRVYVEKELLKKDYVVATELNLSYFKDLQPHYPFSAIRDAVFYKFLWDKYEKSGQIITKKGKKLNVVEILAKYCRGADNVTFEELDSLEAKFHPLGRTSSRSLIAGHSTMVRVSKELFVSESKVDFDIDRIDKMVDLYCRENFIPLHSVTDFSLFPYTGYPWNLFLLESYIRRFSRVFKYDVRMENSSNIGIIVRKSFNYKDYSEILSYALAKSYVDLNNKQKAFNYLLNEGYIGVRNLGKTGDEIINNAKALKKGKLV